MRYLYEACDQISDFCHQQLLRKMRRKNLGRTEVKQYTPSPFVVEWGYNEREPPLFTGKLLIKFQNIPRNTTHVIIRHRITNPIFRHIKSNNSGTAKLKIVKNERDPPLFTGKLLIKFQNILKTLLKLSYDIG